ncbi:acyltransferase family protein [Thalassotalea euphylliae]|uniref:Acyltransferase n=1 Tax=Thalassotalea euphylliae TaxID=1655234 RepID=A0A3E0U331_9GAMM|nr:acyltransferase family protein [Thalassotalea euphylliae]REL31130.1 acyltransferase [Thalassotalea euphylliae]
MRRDIQFLRGIAVLLVVIYHANLGVVNYGYLGVDVFFVVSGFLITTIILKGLEQQTFSFTNFYLRRAKRLLPALYTTLVVTTVLSHFILTPTQLTDYYSQLAGALTFSANIVLPTQIDYFATEAESKPLLHIWSLSLEEQYYFLLPFILFLIPKGYRAIGLFGLAAASFTLCLIWLANSKPPIFLWKISEASANEWAFFLLPTRAWELLFGSICAWLMLKKPNIAIPIKLKIIALLTILVTVIFQIDTIHPRTDALIVVIATTLILLGKDNWLPNNLIVNSVMRVGDWSYSVYLVHWPLFAFAFISSLGEVPTELKLLIIALSILFGFLQYHFIEERFRSLPAKKMKTMYIGLTATTIALLFTPAALYEQKNKDLLYQQYDEIMAPNYGLSIQCDGTKGLLSKDCQTIEKPQIAVWGDSYAMHLVPGLASKVELLQLTKSSCAPFLEISYYQWENKRAMTKEWAKNCIKFNTQAFEIIQNSPSIKFVVLSSAYSVYFDDSQAKFLVNNQVLNKQQVKPEEYFSKTIKALKQAGKIPVVISSPPRVGINIGECVGRESLKLPVLNFDCYLKKGDYLSYDASVIDSLRNVIEENQVEALWLADLLCDQEYCQTKIKDKFLYRDSGHLTKQGSIELFKNLNFDLAGNKLITQ